jgi:hypothetical protein
MSSDRPDEHVDHHDDADHQHPVGAEAVHGMLPRVTVQKGTADAGTKLKETSATDADDSKPEV